MIRYKNIIGVDPGKKGFITVMTDDGGITHYSIPTKKSEVDLHALSELILCLAENMDTESTLVAIENVHAIPGSAASATFTFGGICYALRMGFIMVGFPVVLISPKKWQKEMYVGVKPNVDKKVMSVMAARSLFPSHDLRRGERCTKPDDNLTDSLLIAEYARRNYR